MNIDNKKSPLAHALGLRLLKLKGPDVSAVAVLGVAEEAIERLAIIEESNRDRGLRAVALLSGRDRVKVILDSPIERAMLTPIDMRKRLVDIENVVIDVDKNLEIIGG